ncbi:Ribosomal RNA small subunit methyltransferase [Trichinella spiralis]|uniref:Ribosomal RNA small subunit methyltransferase n=1 Tax=Trichinella spiralis TaxID=6334 RepID=A0ABR3KJP2_TRISP
MESFINNSTDIKNYMNDHYYWKKHFAEFENFPSELLLKLVFNVQNRSAKVIQSKFKTFMTDKAAKEKCEKAAAVIQRNIRHWIKLKKKCVTLNDWPQSNECNLAKLQEKIDLTLSDGGKSNMCISDVRKLHFQAMQAFEKHLKEKAASLKAYQRREIMLHRAKQEMETFTSESSFLLNDVNQNGIETFYSENSAVALKAMKRHKSCAKKLYHLNGLKNFILKS